MRLLCCDDHGKFCFADDLHESQAPYAILSHTWKAKAEELTYDDIKQGTGQQKSGYFKLQFLARQAKLDGFKHFWIDTCCINKDSDAELQSSIRAMFRWYQEAAVCYVYLADVFDKKRTQDGNEKWRDDFRKCRWFRRGWTLQELLAPKELRFFAGEHPLGTRAELCDLISDATGIGKDILLPGGKPYHEVKIQQRLQWINGRETSEPEDLIYCQMGVCGVTLSPHYGEGIDDARKRFEIKIRRQYGNSAFEPYAVESQSSENGAVTRRTRFRSATDSQESLLRDIPSSSKLDRLKFDSMNTRRTTIVKAIGTTCSWFLCDPVYQAWTSKEALQEHHGFLWIKGKPGAGKSVLVKFLETHTRQKKARRDICISFYFNARGEQLEKSMLGMYRSLLFSLFTAVSDLQSILKDTGLNLIDDTEAGLNELTDLIKLASSHLQDRQLFIFVDALDECRDGEVQQMINFFRDLCRDALNDGLTVRVCFASRHYPIVEVPTGLQLTLENATEHTTDLAKYIDSHLVLGTPEQAQSVKNDVLEKSNGVFLWVILVIKILNDEFRNGRIHAVRKRLLDMPKHLEELFSDIIKRDSKNLDECLLCIKWVLYARRPLSLKEFYFAMMAGLEDQSLEWENQVTEEQMSRFLLSSSKGLAELTRSEHPKVQFIHESVRDYLVIKDGLRHLQHDVSAEQDHEMLKQCCLKGIEDNPICTKAIKTRVNGHSVDTEDWKPSSAGAAELRDTVNRKLPFLSYALSSVLYHADQAHPGVAQSAFIGRFDLKSWRKKYNLLQTVNLDIYKRELDLVYVCAERDLSNLIELLSKLKYKHNKNIPQQRYKFPLFAAFANKCMKAARALLVLDRVEEADSIVRTVIVDRPQKRTEYDQIGNKRVQPWRWAISHYYDELAAHLIKTMTAAADLTAFDLEGMTALHHAADKGCYRVVDYLVDWKASIVDRVSTPVGHKHTALMLAASRGYQDVVERLLAAGANPNLRDDNRRTALHYAGRTRNADIAEALLDAKVDINAKDVRGYTALYYFMYQLEQVTPDYLNPLFQTNAVQTLSEGTRAVELLLDRGASLVAAGFWNLTPLHAVVGLGLYDIAERIILQQPVDVNQKDSNNRSVISCLPHNLIRDQLVTVQDAFQRPYTAYVRATPGAGHFISFLVNAGVDPNSMLDGMPPCSLLFYAIAHDNVQLTQKLLENGADIQMKCRDMTALHFAISCVQVAITQILLAHGADVGAVDAKKRTPLHVAVMFAECDVVRLLLEAGASITAEDNAGQNAVEMALSLAQRETLDDSLRTQLNVCTSFLLTAKADRVLDAGLEVLTNAEIAEPVL